MKGCDFIVPFQTFIYYNIYNDLIVRNYLLLRWKVRYFKTFFDFIHTYRCWIEIHKNAIFKVEPFSNITNFILFKPLILGIFLWGENIARAFRNGAGINWHGQILINGGATVNNRYLCNKWDWVVFSSKLN